MKFKAKNGEFDIEEGDIVTIRVETLLHTLKITGRFVNDVYSYLEDVTDFKGRYFIGESDNVIKVEREMSIENLCHSLEVSFPNNHKDQ